MLTKLCKEKSLQPDCYKFCFKITCDIYSFAYLLKKNHTLLYSQVKSHWLMKDEDKNKRPLFCSTFSQDLLYFRTIEIQHPQGFEGTAELEFNRIMSIVVYKHTLEIICSLMGNALLKSSLNMPHLHSLHKIF